MKKIISKWTAAALVSAMAVSGASALAFSDMADTENVVLTRKLGIASGYSDGTYRPNNSITRAEAVKMLVKAVGYEDEASGEVSASSGGIVAEVEGAKQFTDVDKKHWAYNYIQTGVADGIISGFGDGTFRPDDNVTVEQMLTMAVNMAGYEIYATAIGGYPSGYLTYANALEITDDLKVNDGDYKRNATRGEVLDCIANTLNVPICVISDWHIEWNGTKTPTLEVKDGEGRDFQSLLTNMFDIYEVDAAVSEVNNDSLALNIASAINFDNEHITKSKKVTVSLADNDKKNFEKGKKYKMYIKVNDSDKKDYELVCGFLND